MRAHNPDKVGQAPDYAMIVELDTFDSIALPEFPFALLEPAMCPPGNPAKLIVVILE
jgi:hypothetical protein